MARQILSKTQLAKQIGVSRSSLYYRPKRDEIDREVKSQIESVLVSNPAYGHKRIALALKLNKKRILRVMKKYGIKPYRRKAKIRIKKKDIGKPISKFINLIKDIKIIKPNQVWVTDFTYIKFQLKFIYLATIIDLFTREVVGVNISRFHNKYLVIGALEDALSKYGKPDIIHSDQGSEYDSQEFIVFCQNIGIKISMSNKASPWENGYQESFFGHFKTEIGDLNRFEELGEVIEEIYRMIYYYNNQRIHTKLKMSPVKYRLLVKKDSDRQSKKLGT